MLAFDLPAVCGDGRRVPAHKLNAVSGVGRRVASSGLPATRLPSPGTCGGFNSGMRGNGGQVTMAACDFRAMTSRRWRAGGHLSSYVTSQPEELSVVVDPWNLKLKPAKLKDVSLDNEF